MQTLLQDLRYGLRMLRKNPGFATIAVLTLALGIGANMAMFSVLNTYLFRTLPYPEPDRLVRIFRTSPHSPGNFFSHRELNDVFESMAAFTHFSGNLADPGEAADRVRGISATSDYFLALGLQPSLGRVFREEEHEPGSDRVVVLSDRFWLTHYGGDPDIIGRKMRLDGNDVEILGVMPPASEYPLLWNTVDVWRPLAFSAEARRGRGSNYLRSFGRLKPGVSIQQAQEAMVAIAANLSSQNPENAGESLRLEPMHVSMTDDIGRKVMWFTFGLASFVLLIACANIANLQLVRTAARAREYAVRAALGARRARLIRQSLTESLVVSLIGGALSLVLAWVAVGFISRRLFSELPGAKVTLDYRVFAFALLCSVATGLIFGTVPAWLASRTDLNNTLRQNSRGSTVGRSHHRLRNGLIIGEVAFALILLTGGALFVRGIQRAAHLDPGWEVDGLLMAFISPRGSNYSNGDQRIEFYRKLEEKLRALPGVEQASISNSAITFSFNSSGSFRIEGEPEPQPGQWPETIFEAISPQFFETLRVKVLEGRAFNYDDGARSAPVIIINETMAKKFWPNESAIGKRVGRPGTDPRWMEVVGVVNDLDTPANLAEPYTRYQSYRPLTQQSGQGGTIVLRTSGPPDALAGSLRAAAAEIDPAQPVYGIRSARNMVDQGLGRISLLGTLLGAFALLGLTLSAIGIYGVTSNSVVQRTGEIGIRMALGAARVDVLRLILGKGLTLIIAGAVLGLAGSYAVARLLIWLIPALPTRDPWLLAGLELVMVLVALAACWIPAQRATRVDPMVALRQE
jgi:predicted permease